MVKKNRKEKIRDLAKSYEPTPHERAALEAYRIQEEESPLAPRLRVTENDGNLPGPSEANCRKCPSHGRPRDKGWGLPRGSSPAACRCRIKGPESGRPDTEFHAFGGQRDCA